MASINSPDKECTKKNTLADFRSLSLKHEDKSSSSSDNSFNPGRRRSSIQETLATIRKLARRKSKFLDVHKNLIDKSLLQKAIGRHFCDSEIKVSLDTVDNINDTSRKIFISRF